MTDALESRLATLEAHLESLEAKLEAKLERKDERIATLESRVDEYERRLHAQDERIDDQSKQLDTHAEQLEDHADTLATQSDRIETQSTQINKLDSETDRLEAITEATRKRTGANKARIEELQARELEKGAHLRTDNVDEHEIDVPDGRLERITKTDNRPYYRLPDHEDPLNRDDVTLAHGDLLPIQQLARMDTDMRRATADALPTRLAARLWEARADPTVGDDPWTTGCKSVREYVAASDLKHWIRRQEEGISETYAKKLVSRTIDAALELSKNRLAVRKRTQRKNGLEYTERRLILPADAEVPSETAPSRNAERSPSSTTTRNSSDPTATGDS
ncbi:hypothetical protein JMJ58_02455 [Haloterrigena salifodinae]|uniref:Uncharacterized protein n=1 Tax=Haloterrigena salifodinae TaxID=2675099 RepID=A0A8T8E1S6_9EURY|nr:hypothetical protein [Haloterrigena salifodinae]QRV15784.1 hypothetical protein JMJ58_02455 [Haloterrigena salifodinae]